MAIRVNILKHRHLNCTWIAHTFTQGLFCLNIYIALLFLYFIFKSIVLDLYPYWFYTILFVLTYFSTLVYLESQTISQRIVDLNLLLLEYDNFFLQAAHLSRSVSILCPSSHAAMLGWWGRLYWEQAACSTRIWDRISNSLWGRGRERREGGRERGGKGERGLSNYEW